MNLFRVSLFLCFVALFGCFVSFGQIRPINDLDPTVILISIDGFRYDYLDLHKPTHLRELAKTGVRARWLVPVFPTKTFPNHYTIATGLFPEKHGIIENNMYDPESDSVFALDKREEVQNPRWWRGEPIWVTAEKQGQISAAFFFPGTETKINGRYPTHWKPYDGSVPNEERIDAVLGWLDLPKSARPTFITTYFSDVDDAGHRYSPAAAETADAVRSVDAMVRRLTDGLKTRGIFEKVNLIIVSDHGMAASPVKNMIVLDEMFDTSLAKRIFWVDEFVQIFPGEGNEVEIYDSIKLKLPKYGRIYRKSEMPSRYRFGKNSRIAPILVLPDEGWRLVTRKEYDLAIESDDYQTVKGSHGYDNGLKSMRALFIGHGEAFKRGLVADPFENLEIYNLMCRILGLTPVENDGDFKNIEYILKR